MSMGPRVEWIEDELSWRALVLLGSSVSTSHWVQSGSLEFESVANPAVGSTDTGHVCMCLCVKWP